VATGKLLGTPFTHGAAISALSVGPDGRTILTGSYSL
jgi:hypothetical protein